MKIAVLTQYFPSSAQPWQGNSAYQTVRLLAQRHDVRVFFPESRYPKVLTPRSRTHGTLDPAWQPADVRVDYIPYTALPVISRPLNGWSIACRLLAPIRAFAPDVILSYVIYPDGYAATRIGRALNVPVVTTAIGSDLNRIPGRIVSTLTQRTLRDAAITTTVSHDLRQTAARLGAPAANTTAILNGCDTSIFHPHDRTAARAHLGLGADQQIILYVGRLDLRKGLRELIAACATLAATHPNLHLYLVGEGPDRPQLEQAASAASIGDRAHFTPAAPAAQVALWMSAADLVTLPSYMEGCPNVVLEALACGRPMVTTRVGGIPELMDETSGRMVPPRNAQALATALSETLQQDWDTSSIAERHSRSWNDVAADLEAVLHQAVSR